MTLTEAIAAEHATLLKRFAEVERVLPRLRTRAQVRAMAALVGVVLGDHTELEAALAFVPLLQTLRRTGQLTRLAQAHHEINMRLRQARQAQTSSRARQLLRAALRASRAHLRDEERSLFPAIKSALKPEAQMALGNRFSSSRQPLTVPANQSAFGFEANLLPPRTGVMPARRELTALKRAA